MFGFQSEPIEHIVQFVEGQRLAETCFWHLLHMAQYQKALR
jgi:hypothetical protein